MASSGVIWLVLLLALAAAAPFMVERYRLTMNDKRRGAAPGQFAELGQGVTHYHISGPAEGPLVVCVHGLTTPSFVWGPLAKGLTALGFRVLVYDLYGRGFSDRPKGVQDKVFFNRQLEDLLAHLGVEEPFHLIGYSMGGAVAAGFAATHPARVRRLALLASAGMTRADAPLVRFIRDRGIAGQWLMLAAYPRKLRRGIKAEHEDHDVPTEIPEGQHAQLMFQGFIPAVLSSLRGILSRPLQSEHLALRHCGLPVLALWGAEDDVIPAIAMGQLAAWNRDATHKVIEGAGHGLPYTHTAEALAYIATFLPRPEANDGSHDT